MDTIANTTVPAGSTEQWRDPKRYLWLIGLVVPSLFFLGYGGWLLTGWPGLFWIGPVVILVIVPAIDLFAGLDRSNPPDDVIEALEQDRYYRWITYLFLPIQYVGFVAAMYLIARGDPLGIGGEIPLVGQGRPRGLDRLHRRHRHQHRARARPQEGEQRALAVQDRPGAELLRPLLHRAQPRPPRPRRHAGGPGQQPGGRELLPVLAAHGPRLRQERVAHREAPLRPQEAAPVPHRQRRAQRLADVAGAVGRARRLAGRRDPALPRHPGRGRLLAARGRQLHGALRDAAPEGRRRRAAALRAGRPLALVELQQHRDQRAALPPAAAQRPPRQPDPALPVPARLRGVAGAADRVRRDDRPVDRARGLAAGDGPAGARPLRRRPEPGEHLAAQARQDPRDVPAAPVARGAAQRPSRDPGGAARPQVEVLAAQCPGCGYVYEVEAGDEHEGFAAGTAWKDVPDTWCCPDCGVREKVDFVPLDREPAR